MVSMNVLSHRLWLTAALAVGFASIGAAQTKPEYVPGQVIVKFRPGFAGTSRTTHATINARVTREISPLGYQVIQLRSGMTVDAALKYYGSLTGVESVKPNYVYKKDFTPNDPRYANQWWLKKVGAPTAWDITLGLPTVKIAVCDTGVDYNHEDLKGKVILGRDTINNDNDPMDDDGHGTHVAGIAAANSNNGIGGAGLGFNCQIIAVKVLGTSGGSDATVAEGIINATDLGAKVINLSLGGAGDGQASRDAITYAKGKGVVVLAAAGNDGVTDKHYPGAVEDCICVAATDDNDKRADFSNYGKDWVDVAAPGVAILSTLPNNAYGDLDGTSMATPVVAGLAGLLWAHAPTVSNADIRTAIESTCINVGDFISKGRIDATAALNSLVKPVEFEGFPNSANIYSEGSSQQGSNMLGTFGDLKVADNKVLSVDSVYLPQNGWSAGVRLSVAFPATAANFIDANLTFRHRSTKLATNSLFIYNFRTAKYELYKSVPGSETTTATTVAVTKKMLTDYVSGSEMRFVVRGYISSRAARNAQTFKLSVDQVILKGRLRPEED